VVTTGRFRRRRPGRSGQPRRHRRNDPRWLLPALGISLVLFLFASSHKRAAPPQQELPTPAAQSVGLGLPGPTKARLHVGEFLQVQLPTKDGDRFGTVISQSNDRPVLEVTNNGEAPPLLRGVAQGSVVVTVLLEPRCPPEGVCREYRRNLGAVRVTVAQ
jgi:hypothetical protein